MLNAGMDELAPFAAAFFDEVTTVTDALPLDLEQACITLFLRFHLVTCAFWLAFTPRETFAIFFALAQIPQAENAELFHEVCNGPVLELAIWQVVHLQTVENPQQGVLEIVRIIAIPMTISECLGNVFQELIANLFHAQLFCQRFNVNFGLGVTSWCQTVAARKRGSVTASSTPFNVFIILTTP
jgi:hypothetical protein